MGPPSDPGSVVNHELKVTNSISVVTYELKLKNLRSVNYELKVTN